MMLRALGFGWHEVDGSSSDQQRQRLQSHSTLFVDSTTEDDYQYTSASVPEDHSFTTRTLWLTTSTDNTTQVTSTNDSIPLSHYTSHSQGFFFVISLIKSREEAICIWRLGGGCSGSMLCIYRISFSFVCSSTRSKTLVYTVAQHASSQSMNE